MFKLRVVIALMISSSVAAAQEVKPVGSAPLLHSPTTLPIVFTESISAGIAQAGEPVLAKTTQAVRLANGVVIPSGARVAGHVLAADAYTYDKTPYAHQRPSTLSIHFDSVQVAGSPVPVNVSVRAMADPITSWGAREPKSSDLDPLNTVTQIGGDQLTPSQSEVVSPDGEVVAYNKLGGVYAHLIANGNCDGSSSEVSVSIYSASACGLYGFAEVSARDMGSAANPSTLTLASTHTSPRIWKNSTALLEVLPDQPIAAH